MQTVRLRSRKSAAAQAALTRAREIQGMLAMCGLDVETEPTTIARTEAAQTSSVGKSNEVKPLPYRQVLATWTDDWRERWGRRANELEDTGLPWRDAEGRAFVEILKQLKSIGQTERN